MTKVCYSDDAVIRWQNDISLFRVEIPFRVTWKPDPNSERVFNSEVEAGFLTNLASIPQAFRSFIPQIDHHLQPAIFHDWCYSHDTGLTRAQADLLFLDGMEDMGVDYVTRYIMYAAVRNHGAEHWQNAPDPEDVEGESEDWAAEAAE